MSRTMLLISVLLVLAPGLYSQDTTVARLRRRADSLAAEWRRADALAIVADSLELERAAAGRDTLSAGQLRIVANPSPLPLAEAAARAWPVLDSLYGTSARTLSSRPLFIRAFDPDTMSSRPVLRTGFELPWNLGVNHLTDFLLANVPVEPPDRSLADWLGAPIRPLLQPKRDQARVYVRLVTAPSQVTRACFLGAIASCGDALDLRSPPDAFLRWYPSAAERRRLLESAFSDYFNRTATAATWRSCMTGSDAACIELLRSLPPGSIPRLLDTDARLLLVHMALRAGGREAYARLLADSTLSPGERLARSAGLSVDTLLVRWRAAVLASRPSPVAIPSWGAAAAVAWVILLAACGMSSSRWRAA